MKALKRVKQLGLTAMAIIFLCGISQAQCLVAAQVIIPEDNTLITIEGDLGAVTDILVVAQLYRGTSADLAYVRLQHKPPESAVWNTIAYAENEPLQQSVQVGEGVHKFRAVAVDINGEADTNPTEVSVTVQVVQPEPEQGPTPKLKPPKWQQGRYHRNLKKGKAGNKSQLIWLLGELKKNCR